MQPADRVRRRNRQQRNEPVYRPGMIRTPRQQRDDELTEFLEQAAREAWLTRPDATSLTRKLNEHGVLFTLVILDDTEGTD